MGSFELQEEPLSCDFDGDLDCDIDEVDNLFAQLGGSNPLFDLDNSGMVDNDDVTEWLLQASAADPLGRTFVRGDANLDGSVGGSDFTALATNFGTVGAWGSGNFVVDAAPGGGIIGGSDFTALATNFGFTSATASGVRLEPGPAGDRRPMIVDGQKRLSDLVDREEDVADRIADAVFGERATEVAVKPDLVAGHR